MPLSRPTQLACVAVLLAAPFALVMGAAASLVEPLAQAVAGSLVTLAQSLPLSSPAAPAPDEAEPLAPSALGAPGELGLSAVAAPARQGAGRRGRSAAPSVPKGLFVSAATVLQLAESSARPAGSFVGTAGERPAGLRLTRVAALGIGLQDGDILIEALGQPARSSGELIASIIAARAQKARQLHGRIWRRGQTFGIVVEQPYPGS